MMTFTKMAPDAWRYYAEEVATGREDYYAAAAEHPGCFVGRGAEALALSSVGVTALGLERIFGNGANPVTGEPLGRGFAQNDDRVVAGFAMSFSPPKSVSVLWACADENTAAVVLAAHEAAVEVALRFLDDHASFTRRGHNGVLQVDTDGFVGATFIHRTSRAADPQLHTHLLVANKVQAADGRWLSIDARELFGHQKAAGMLYKAALRAELTARAGVGWTEVDDNGIAEIVGVPQGLSEAWSARRKELTRVAAGLIAEREADGGRTVTAGERAEIFQLAAYRTRTPKVDADTSTAELRSRWHDEAVAFGHDPAGWLSGTTGDHLARQRVAARTLDENYITAAIARLEDRSATWGRADVVEVLSTIVAANDASSLRERIEQLATRVLRDPRVVCLAAPLPAVPPAALLRGDGMSALERHGAVRFTSRTTLLREAAILDAVRTGQSAGVGAVEVRLCDELTAHAGLGDDQRAAVRALVTGGERVALLVGPAGAGKSRALGAARVIWERAGYSTLGLAPSAMAAGVLSEEAGLRAETLAKFLLDVSRADGPPLLDHRSVVILDEAGMARTDDLERLVREVERAGSKLVLVGDPAQLGAVGPGGIFRTLVSDHGANELETVRRFDHAWEAVASLRLRARDPGILPAYVRRGRIEGGSRDEMIDAAFSAWRGARDEGRSMIVMAGDNATARELSLRCRADLVARGEVERDGVATGSGTVGLGDEIVTLRNDRRLRAVPDDFVRNGDRWRVVDTFSDGSLTCARFDRAGVTRGTGASVTLPPDYVREHVALGYALTVHKAQGSTVDRAVVVVDDQMTAAQLYVAMTRGRSDNRALVVTSDPSSDEHGSTPTVDAVQILAGVMRRDTADRSAHEVLRANLATFEDVVLLRDLAAEARRVVEKGAGPDRSEEIAAMTALADVETATERLRAAEGRARQAEQLRAEAEARVADVERAPVRARVPGRIGEQARRDAAQERLDAVRRLGAATNEERSSMREFEVARHELDKAGHAARDLDELQHAQDRRRQWIDAHPDEVKWADELQVQLERRSNEHRQRLGHRHASDRTSRTGTSSNPSRFPRAVVEPTAALTDEMEPEPREIVEQHHARLARGLIVELEAPEYVSPTANGPTLRP